MEKQKLVLIGNGMAGVKCMEEILRHQPDRFDVTIIGSEPHVNYNRILLSTVLQGGMSLKEITINDRSWYEENNIQLFTGEKVLKIDKAKQVLKTDKNREVSYDQLIVATGSVPFLLPLPGTDKEGVITFRTIEDCQKMIESSKHYKKATVIGGGVLGLEAARGLLNLGMEVNVVHIASFIMERQLDQAASMMLQKELENQGMHFLVEKETKEIIGNSRVEGLIFNDGTKIETNLIVMAAGVRPNVQLARESGIETNRGIVVNDYLETSAPNVYAVGECVEHRGMVYGLVKPLFEQGQVLAKRICGIDCKGYEGSVLSTQLKIAGVDVFSAGTIDEGETPKSIKIVDEVNGVYKKIVFQDHKMIGAVLFGDTRDGSRLLDLIVKQQELSNVEREKLLQSSNQGFESVVAMSDGELICNCNGVTKRGIIEAVQKEDLTTVEQIRKSTKASGSCGGCKPLVSTLLSYVQSREFIKAIEPIPSLCGCTSMTEDEVVWQMQLKNLESLQEVMDGLNWKNKQGCETCRSALNYYLGMIDPKYVSSKEDGNRVQYVNTNIAEQNCECDQQHSLQLAADLNKKLAFLPTPSRIEMAVSACMHNITEATSKDLGAIRLHRGWEIYVGSSFGRSGQTGELVYIAETAREAMEVVSALIQYYRETGNYLERIGKWLERVGLIHIREVLFDDEYRLLLLKRLEEDVMQRKDLFEKSFFN
ncbi:nitrite reductase large subunit NirB [Bacillota bacterium Lsc_1132]